MWEISKEFNALVVFAEHRYYGTSLPYESKSYDDKQKLGYLTSQQALADYVDLVKYLRDNASKQTGGKNHPNPVITFGGSYGGMLAAWMRMKYPASCNGSV